VIGCALALVMAGLSPAPPQEIVMSDTTIVRNGSIPAAPGAADYFIGTVRIENPFAQVPPATLRGAVVHFSPGARTAWHTHPLGQTLVVTQGLGWFQREGGPVETVRPGDTVVIAANERHWHGATAVTGMSHIALQEALNGEVVTWMEQVTDEQYLAGPTS
jgi:quercetin dioxygenase-like cupin family protein